MTRPAEEIEATVARAITTFEGDDGVARAKAREGLVALGKLAVPGLEAVLGHEDKQVRWEAAKSLQQIEHTRSIPGLVATLADRESDIRWIAAEGLKRYGIGAIAPILDALVRHGDLTGLRRGARHVLRDLEVSDETRKRLQPVIDAVDGPAPDEETPVEAKRALVEYFE